MSDEKTTFEKEKSEAEFGEAGARVRQTKGGLPKPPPPNTPKAPQKPRRT